MKKEFIIYFKSRYHPLEGTRRIVVYAPSKKHIRSDWHNIIHTDEYKIVKIEEVVLK